MLLDGDDRTTHSNVGKWDLHYPPGTEFAENLLLSPERSRIPVERYLSGDRLAAEIDRVWKHVWQFACRSEDVEKPGDYLEYRLADQSFLVVRGADGVLRAFYDACRHRGNLLKCGRGNASELRCGFHYWCYNLDGTLKEVPDRHLFSPIDDAAYGLRTAACDEWAGFVFVHPEATPAQSLREFLGPVADQLDPYHLERMRATLDATLHVACNWKVAVEAFLEVYHVQAIHPQLMPISDDINTSYEVMGDHSRMIVPYGVPSMRLEHVDPAEVYEAYIASSLEAGFKEKKAPGTERDAIRLPDDLFDAERNLVGDTNVRAHLIGRIRRRGARLGHDYSELIDDQMVDDWHYLVFPGMIFNLYAGGFLLFRLRPDASDPDHCWFDVYTFAWPDEHRRAELKPVPHIDADAATHSFGLVLDQDFANLPGVQRGLHSDSLEHITVSAQEIRVVALHETIDRYIATA